MISPSEFTITVRFNDGTIVEIGGATSIFIHNEEPNVNSELDEDRLRLIALLQAAERTATMDMEATTA